MPEGDTIYRAAMNLRKVLEGEEIADATGRQGAANASDLVGSRVLSVESRGKHLIIHLSGDRAIHSHMGMTGSWHIYRPNDPWQKPRHFAHIEIHTEHWCVVCFTPKLLEIVTERQLLRDDYLRHLGPDLLGGPIDDETVLSRFRTQNSVSIGEAVMNQTVVSGIGNVYKSEVLFLEQIHPLTKVRQLTDTQLLRVRDQAVYLMKRNLDGTARRTRFRSGGERTWVYGRQGEPCFTCGSEIEMIRQGELARSTYFCPDCQPLLDT